MTPSELLQIGDEVIFRIDSETRDFTDTYDNVPDGTKGVVCGFYNAIIYYGRTNVLITPPGAYYQRGAVSVWLPDGRTVPGNYHIEMVDREEETRRSLSMRDANGLLHAEMVRLGDLPPTPFWESDKVLVHLPNHGDEMMTIGNIEYRSMYACRNDGSPWPFYSVHWETGGTTSAEESWIELLERGPVWKFYHGEPLTFSDLKEEATFFESIGHSEEVRNPANSLYSWNLEEVIAAIQDGTVHGFRMSPGLFRSRPSISARRFKDVDLGRRVAQATLEGFGVS